MASPRRRLGRLGRPRRRRPHDSQSSFRTTKNEFSTQFQITIFNQTEIKWPASCVVLLVALLALVAELLVGLFGDRHFVALLAVLDVGDSLATTGSGLYYLLNLRHAFADIRGLPLTSDGSHVFLI